MRLRVLRVEKKQRVVHDLDLRAFKMLPNQKYWMSALTAMLCGDYLVVVSEVAVRLAKDGEGHNAIALCNGLPGDVIMVATVP